MNNNNSSYDERCGVRSPGKFTYVTRKTGDLSLKKWNELTLQRSNVYRYEGSYKLDKKDGFGVIRFLDGDVYIGVEFLF